MGVFFLLSVWILPERKKAGFVGKYNLLCCDFFFDTIYCIWKEKNNAVWCRLITGKKQEKTGKK